MFVCVRVTVSFYAWDMWRYPGKLEYGYYGYGKLVYFNNQLMVGFVVRISIVDSVCRLKSGGRHIAGPRVEAMRGPWGNLPSKIMYKTNHTTVDGCEILHQLIDGLSHYL